MTIGVNSLNFEKNQYVKQIWLANDMSKYLYKNPEFYQEI